MLVHSRATDCQDQHHRTLIRRRTDLTNSICVQDDAATYKRSSKSLNHDFGPRVKDIVLTSREGERFTVPMVIAVQLSSKLREYVVGIETECTSMGRYDSVDFWRQQSLEMPCCSEVLRTLVDFFVAKLQLDIRLSEERSYMSVEKQQEYWRNYFYVRIAWKVDLDMFADETLKVAEFLRMNSLYDLLWCCFRVRIMSRFDEKDATDVYMD